MDLLSLISWALIELRKPSPDLQLIQTTLEKAFAKAQELHVKHDQRTQSLIRLAASVGA